MDPEPMNPHAVSPNPLSPTNPPPLSPPPPLGQPDAYDAVADAYDRFWGDLLAPPMLRALDRLLAPVRPSVRGRVLDLCCGTGQLAAGLIARGWTVVGVDGSGAMLDRARRRAPAAEWVQADMRAFEAGDGFDACICAFDSLNHLPSAPALAVVFARVLDALRPGGRFVFDVNTCEGFEARFQGSLGFAADDLVCTVLATLEGDLGRYALTILRPDGPPPTNRWLRSDATLIQRCFEIPEILGALDAAGFGDPTVLDAEDDLGLEGHIGRAVFVVDRPMG